MGRGALKVSGGMYIDDEPVWGLTEDGTARFPARFPVEPLVVLDPARGVPGPEAAKALTCLSRLKHWGTFLQRSLNEVPDADGERLLAMLREPRPEVPITVPQRRARRASAAQAPERGHLEAQAQPPTLTSIDGGGQAEDELSRARIARFRPTFATSGSSRATTCGWPIGASNGTARSWAPGV